MIRTVIFDLGRVLVPFDFQIAYELMSRRCGLEPAEIKRRFSNSKLAHGFESGDFDEFEFQRRVEELLETKVEAGEFRNIWFSVFHPHTLIPESMVAGIRKNFRTVLLSNTNPIHFTMLYERYPILQHFDAYILSHEVGAMKPLPSIYQAAIAAAGCQPEECFFTDDVAEYVEGARSAGIDAVQFQSCEQIQQELKARGVYWE
ncbi:MAG: HAD family phosphatase [Acidobacteria bacterium]|nr:HAD family phosphatase [Acidobacteriota bacterium]